MTDTKQPEALRLAEILEGDYCPDWFYEQGVDEVAAELRRQHARIAELEARIKTMAEEHADELMVAHLDGRMRAAQAIPGVQWQCGPQANGFTAPQADSVLEDAARLDWLDQNIFYREMDEWDAKHGGRGDCTMWVIFAPKGHQGSARNIIDAARKQGGAA